jgi:hypothetical protein
MSKKSDDSIERIFRQALTQYDTTFQESDWVKMEKLLNEEANRKAAARSKRIKGIAYTLTGLTGLIIAVYFLAFRNPSGSIAELNNAVNEVQATGDLEKKGNVKLEDPSAGLLSDAPRSKEAVDQQEKETAGVSDKAVVGDSNPPANKDANASHKTSEKKRIISPGEKSVENTAQLQKNQPLLDSRNGNKKTQDQLTPTYQTSTEAIGPTPSEASETIGKQATEDIGPTDQSVKKEDGSRTKSAITGSGAATQLNLSPTPTQSNSSILATPPGTTSQNVEKSDLSSATAETSKATAQDSVLLEEKPILAFSTDSLENAKTKPEKPSKVKPPYRWSIGIILAPEFSTTSLSEYSAPGGSFGLRIGYQVSNRFNITTGIIRSTKKYDGDGYDYTPRNPLYWQIRTNGVVPEEIDSKCLVYELPLDVQFDAIQTQKSRVFLSAAISSYFMVSQAYDYTFDSPNPGADMGWRSSGSESYWFSVGMVSAGYERYVHRSFAIGIEPYLKASFSEIGWPNIKLFSAGAYVTLRYRFMNRKNIE